MKNLKPALLSLVTLASSLTSFAQTGSGWTKIDWAATGGIPAQGQRRVHLRIPSDSNDQNWVNESKIYYYNNASDPRGTYEYQKESATEIFQHYGPPDRSVNRSEIRISENYGQGQARQLEGYVTFNDKLSTEQAFLQIWGWIDPEGATLLQLRGKNGKITVSGRAPDSWVNMNPDFPAINYSNREFKLNVLHKQETGSGSSMVNGRVEIYVDGLLLAWIRDSNITKDPSIPEGTNYFKYGCYGKVEADETNARVVWKEAAYYKDGRFPGTTEQVIDFTAPASISLGGGLVTLNGASKRTNGTATGLSVSYRSSDPTVIKIANGNQLQALKQGQATIWAYHNGNDTFKPAPVRTAVVTVTSGGTVQQSQTINFAPLPAKLASDAPFALSATATSGLPVSFASDNASVATISGNTVTLVGAGTANITASQAGNASYLPATPVVRQLTVNPANVAVTGVSVTPETLSLTVGATGSLTATVSPANATNKSVTWSSSSAAATVSSSGVVTAQSVGTAIITARTTDGNFTDTTNVTVTSTTTPPTGATPITAPFVKDGAGDFYWVVTSIPGKYFEFNSWNLSKLEINGVDLTNKWASTQSGVTGAAPAPINGQYFIRYTGAFAWSHFDIAVKP
jgi:uncharacterized protein YjdB